MINSKISAALATQLNTLELPTHWENAKFTPTNGQIYLSETLLSGDTIPVGVSSAASDEFGGVYQVLVYAPADANKGPARSIADDVAAAFQRGDILFLNNSVDRVYVGDVVVFKIRDRDIPIVHRILKVHEKSDGKVELLTKGDNNRVDDRGLYAPGQLWLEREDILGKAVGTLRYVGMVTIALNDYPVLKYVLVGMMGLFVLTSKEG